MSDYIGMDVSIQRSDGVVISGNIAFVDTNTSSLKLTKAKTSLGEEFPIIFVKGSTITQLDLIAPSNDASSHKSEQVAKSAANASSSKLTSEVSKALNSTENNAGSASKKKNKKLATPGSNQKPPNSPGLWQNVQVSDFQDQDFDFQSNLELFNKRKTFDEFRKDDNTSSSDRLVTHNLNRTPGKYVQKGSVPILSEHTELTYVGRATPDALSDLTKNPLPNKNKTLPNQNSNSPRSCSSPSQSLTNSNKKSNNNDIDLLLPKSDSSKTFYMKNTNQKVPVVSSKEFRSLIQHASDHLHLRASDILQTGAVSLAGVVMDHLNSTESRGNKMDIAEKHLAPVIVIMIGYHYCGHTAVSAGRLLAYSGYRVILGHAYFLKISPDFQEDLNAFRAAGGKISKNVAETVESLSEPPSLIIDATLNSELVMDDLWSESIEKETLGSIEWMFKSQIPIISLNFPSIINMKTLKPYIQLNPAFDFIYKVVCIGPPRTQLLKILQNGDLNSQMEIYLANLGLPWSRLLEIQDEAASSTETLCPLLVFK